MFDSNHSGVEKCDNDAHLILEISGYTCPSCTSSYLGAEWSIEKKGKTLKSFKSFFPKVSLGHVVSTFDFRG